MTLQDWELVIEGLSEEEQIAFGNICINQDQDIPLRIAKALKKRGLIERVPDGWACASIPIHYAWCQWYTKSLAREEK